MGFFFCAVARWKFTINMDEVFAKKWYCEGFELDLQES